MHGEAHLGLPMEAMWAVMMYCVPAVKPTEVAFTGAEMEYTLVRGAVVTLMGLPGTGPGFTMDTGGSARISPLVPSVEPPVFCCRRRPALVMDEVATVLVLAVCSTGGSPQQLVRCQLAAEVQQ